MWRLKKLSRRLIWETQGTCSLHRDRKREGERAKERERETEKEKEREH